MKFPASMLREMVETSLTADEIGDLLTMAGFELEGIEEVEGEAVLDIKVVSNRGDGLSVLGLAREILAKDGDAKPTELYSRSANRFSDSPHSSIVNRESSIVNVSCPDCTRYAAAIVENIRNGDAPEWIQERIRQAGWRPISLLVDLTNYVMLEQGQPLHAFDLDKLHGGRIVVRLAEAGDKLTTLDGNEHELLPNQMMICDADRAVAAAGVMGGLDTEVSSGTSRMLLESAHFVNTSVRKTRNQLGLSTEASYRFERSVDPEGVVAAIHRVLELLQEIQPGVKVTAFEDVYPLPPTQRSIELSVERASKLLGMEITVDEARRYLEALGFQAAQISTPLPLTPYPLTFRVAVPTWRPDVVREEDVIEELGRVHGYEKIPALLPQGSTTQGGVFGFEAFVDRIREECVRLGLQQIVSHSLRDLHPLDATGERVGPRNPGSPEMAYLRNSLQPSLADAARRNGGRDVQLFEIGRVFSGTLGAEKWSAADGREPVWNSSVEMLRLGMLVQGLAHEADWLNKAPNVSQFFSVTSSLAAIAEAVCRRAPVCHTVDKPDPRLHPTRQAIIGDECLAHTLGLIGQIHPDVAEEVGLPEDTILAEIDLLELWGCSEERFFKAVSRQPSVRRDMAVLVEKSVRFASLEGKIHEAVGDVLERMWLFDVYEGQGIPEGKHSLGIALQLRKQDSTFTDEEANLVRERAVKAIESLGATTR